MTYGDEASMPSPACSSRPVSLSSLRTWGARSGSIANAQSAFSNSGGLPISSS